MRTLAPAVLLAAVVAHAAGAQCSAFANTPPGTDLALREEGVRSVLLGFSFRFHNVLYDRIAISDNGYVWLGSPPATGASDFSPTAAEMLSQPARLCVCWNDLHSDSVLVGPGSGVFFRTDGATANVVWKGIPRFFHQQVYANMELVLTADTHPTSRNEITFVYDAAMMPMTATNIVGITAGGGIAAPGPTEPPTVAWTAFAPATLAQPVGYQVFTPATGATPFNLVGQTLRFAPVDPNTASAHAVSLGALPTCAPLTSYPAAASQPVSFGAGCPAAQPAGSIYETFTVNTGTAPFDLGNGSVQFYAGGGSYTAFTGVPFDPNYTLAGVALAGGDDTVQTLSLGAMGSFSFGTLTVTQVVLCSNGFLWLPTGTGTSFTPTAAAFNTEAPRIAPFWTDLNSLTTTGGGAMYWENSNPAFCRATFAGVREFNQATSSNTFQVTLFSSGDIAFSYDVMSGGISHAALVGISGGGVTADPGSFDFATAGVNNVVVRNISPVSAMVHTLAGPCQLGLPFQMASTVPAPLSGLGFFVIGGTAPNVPLDFLGAPGCSLYATLDNLFVVPFAASPMTHTVPVPSTLALAGILLYSQAAAISTLNAFGIIGSNGQGFTLGI